MSRTVPTTEKLAPRVNRARASGDCLANDRSVGSPATHPRPSVRDDVLDRLRTRDREALADLVREFGPALTHAAYAQLGDADAAADAVQETFLAAWDGARRTTTATPVRAWLFGILFKRCFKRRRSSARRRAHEAHAARSADVASSALPDAAALHDELAERLARALGQLDDAHRAVMVLRFGQELGVAETAAALGIPPGTVKSRTKTALRRLRELDRWTDDERE